MTAAERMRVSRERRRDGSVLTDTIILSADDVAELVSLGWVKAGASPDDVRDGFCDMVDAAFAVNLRPDRSGDRQQ